MWTKQAQQKSHHDQRTRHCEFSGGQSAKARNLGPGPAWVPAVIVVHLGPLTYLVKTTDRMLWKHHIDLIWELAVSSNLPEPGGSANPEQT